MINLHEIIELSAAKKLMVFDGICDHDALILDQLVNKYAGSAIGFHMGEIDFFENLKGPEYLTLLPYPICWFELDYLCTNHNPERFGKKEHFGLLCWESDNGKHITCIGLKKQAGYGWLLFGGSEFENTGNGIKVYTLGGQKEEMDALCHTVSIFINVLNCTNVKTIENNPPEKLQKKRKKKGKVPMFSYWTLHLDLPGEKTIYNESRGGTHASPRLHLRRGHAREYKPGKWTWVQPCMVGSKENGFIHKDYDV
jgi:hypothetical protein